MRGRSGHHISSGPSYAWDARLFLPRRSSGKNSQGGLSFREGEGEGRGKEKRTSWKTHFIDKLGDIVDWVGRGGERKRV